MSFAFVLLCFLGIVAMFVYIQKRLERMSADILRECEQLRAMILTLTEAMGADAESDYNGSPLKQATDKNYDGVQKTHQEELETLPSTLPEGVTVEQLSAIFHSEALLKKSND